MKKISCKMSNPSWKKAAACSKNATAQSAFWIPTTASPQLPKHAGKPTKQAPRIYHLAGALKELTQTVVKTIDNGRTRIQDMPHAKKKLNPLWSLLAEPLFQIIAAVGLLLSGVLGLVSRLLDVGWSEDCWVVWELISCWKDWDLVRLPSR
jgi:hypothetical protein